MILLIVVCIIVMKKMFLGFVDVIISSSTRVVRFGWCVIALMSK